ncbi:hypothetical protein HanHA300_Chr12g0438071 [Helianthus annuus]|nr:hypothetical protein HanHA300_Chr12g0438071 [Helianthus annuus]KAJ0674480.1 hypothetical protein HanLR1_Chr12g0440411 [Helianthus annuus]
MPGYWFIHKMDPRIETQSTVLGPNQKGFHYSMRESYEEVWEQKFESCFSNSLTHMLTILHRKTPGNEHLRLSPNTILSLMQPNGIILPKEALRQVINEGLEELEIKQAIYEKVENFQYKVGSKRYKLKSFETITRHFNIC